MQRALVALCVFALLLAAPLSLLADSEGPRFPSVGEDNTLTGTLIWSSPSSITSSNNVDASVVSNTTALTHFLRSRVYAFSVPAGAEINGILCEIEQQGTKNGTAFIPSEATIRLMDGSSALVGDNKSTGATLPGTDTFISYGGSADDWNAGLTSTDINDSDFGCLFSVQISGDGGTNFSTANVDSMRITVTFTPTSSQSKLLITQTRRAATFQLASIPGGRRIRPMKSIYSYISPKVQLR